MPMQRTTVDPMCTPMWRPRMRIIKADMPRPKVPVQAPVHPGHSRLCHRDGGNGDHPGRRPPGPVHPGRHRQNSGIHSSGQILWKNNGSASHGPDAYGRRSVLPGGGDRVRQNHPGHDRGRSNVAEPGHPHFPGQGHGSVGENNPASLATRIGIIYQNPTESVSHRLTVFEIVAEPFGFTKP